jgi:hypothetical protein
MYTAALAWLDRGVGGTASASSKKTTSRDR